MQEKELESKESARVFGQNTLESFASYDPDTSSWKTSQLSLLGDSTPYSETWPRAGMMRNGTSYRLQPLAPRTSVKESGLLLTTPTATVAVRSKDFRKGRLPNCAEIAMFPTPTAQQCGTQGGALSKGGRPGLWTMAAKNLWPTPTASQARSAGMILQMRRRVDAGELTREEAEQMIAGSLEPARMTPWPTPNAFPDVGELPEAWEQRRKKKKEENPNLGDLHLSLGVAVRMKEQNTGQWPTPRTRGLIGGSGSLWMMSQKVEEGTLTQEEAEQMSGSKVTPVADDGPVRLWATPCAVSWKGCGQHGSKSHKGDVAKSRLKGQVMEPGNTGQLNPTWVEWLMGYPGGWTDLEDSETP